MLHEQFELKNAANTVETAASSSKMLQLARQTCRKNGCKKNRSAKKKLPKQFRTRLLLGVNMGNIQPQAQKKNSHIYGFLKMRIPQELDGL